MQKGCVYTYGYSAAGNRTYRKNEAAATRGQEYLYDSLDRLTEFHAGTLDGSNEIPTGGNRTRGQVWTLDKLGNWTTFKINTHGDGLFNEAGDLDQTRTHNAANELTAFTATGWIDPVHDDAGNMTEGPSPADGTVKNKYKYDAWNRLVQVQDEG